MTGSDPQFIHNSPDNCLVVVHLKFIFLIFKATTMLTESAKVPVEIGCITKRQQHGLFLRGHGSIVKSLMVSRTINIRKFEVESQMMP